MELRKDAWGFGASSSPPPQQFPLEILKSFEKRCGHVVQVSGREFRCPKCGLIYNNRDLNASINIAHALTRGMGWGSLALNQQMRLEAQNPLNAGSLAFKGGAAHRYKKCLKTLKLKRHF